MPPEFRGVRDNEPPLRRPGDQPPEDRHADDLRVQPFTDDVFGDYHARRKEPGSSFGLIAGLVIGVAAVAGIGWYMWSSGAIGPVAPNGAPPFVKANPDPYKIKPENPGGMQVANQDKLVYDRVAKGEAPPRVENLLPAPEEPKAPPRPATSSESPPTEAAKPAPVDTAPPAPAPPEPAKEVAKAEPAKPVAPAAEEQDDLAALVAKATGGREAATGPLATKTVPRDQEAPPAETPAADAKPAPEAKPAAPQVAEAPPAVAAPVPPTESPPPATQPAAAGAFQIQLASARSEQGAMGEWNRIIAKNKDTLSGLAPSVARVDLGDKGVFFRLRAGPLADRGAAEALCATLSAQNVGCIVVRP